MESLIVCPHCNTPLDVLPSVVEKAKFTADAPYIKCAVCGNFFKYQRRPAE